MIYQRFISLDDYFKNTSGDKIILNDIKYFSIDDREMINRALVTVYDDNTISLIPSCDCGEMKGGYLLGKLCDGCGTIVKDIQDKTDPLIWLHAVEDMPHFLSPHFWLMMRNVMGKKVDGMRWLSDTSYNPPDIPDYLIAIKNSFEGFERSYPYLVDHIVELLTFLQNHSTFKTPRKLEIINGLISLYKSNKEKLYSYYLPIVNKKLFIMENTSKGKYTNLGIADVIDTTLQFIKTVNDEKLTLNKKSNCMSRTLSDLSTIYGYYNKEYLSRKTGIFRKHIYGARAHFTFRGVIVSIAGPHKYNEIHVPWSIGVTAFRPHLLNLLCNREGLSYKEASSKLFNAVNNYDPLIDKCLNVMLEESGIGIAVILQRNPSLKQGSSNRVYITKFKTDPLDYTIAISILITSLMNADFDGDELNITILGDNNMAKLAANFDPAYSVPGLGDPFEVSGLLNVPKPTVATISNYLTRTDNGVKPNMLVNNMKKVNVEV